VEKNEWRWNHVLASGTVDYKRRNKPEDKGKNNLFTTIVTEAAFHIWELRNEQKLNPRRDGTLRSITPIEARRRFKLALETRMTIDFLSTKTHRYGKSACNYKTMSNTWRKVAKKEKNRWSSFGLTSERWFLVGSENDIPDNESDDDPS